MPTARLIARFSDRHPACLIELKEEAGTDTEVPRQWGCGAAGRGERRGQRRRTEADLRSPRPPARGLRVVCAAQPASDFSPRKAEVKVGSLASAPSARARAGSSARMARMTFRHHSHSASQRLVLVCDTHVSSDSPLHSKLACP